MSEYLLDIKDLRVTYQSDEEVVEAVNDVSLTIHEGEILGLVGETGAGKTTLAKAIMGLIRKPSGHINGGEIHYQDKDLITSDEKTIRQIRGNDISMIFQDPMTSLNPVMTVGDQITEVIKEHRDISVKEAEDAAKEMLQMVGIPADRYYDYPHQFSGGMKQRIVISIALACNPRLLIADEPTTALDVTIQAQILDLINRLIRKNNASMLLITHDLGVVAQNCDRIAIMYAGEIVEEGGVYDIFDHPSHPYTKGLLNSIPKLEQNEKRLQPINGLPPDPTQLPEGCNFYDRCPYRIDRCEKENPGPVGLTPGHRCRCFLTQEEESAHE